MQDPIAYFLTISTYGTWLPGDQRGWVEYNSGWQLPDSARELESLAKMQEAACILARQQRESVERQIAETCQHRGWTLHAANCRSNHMHAVISADNAKPTKVRSDIKAWCTRRLKTTSLLDREHWWAERGSIRYVYNEESLETVIRYVTEAQDRKHLDCS